MHPRINKKKQLILINRINNIIKELRKRINENPKRAKECIIEGKRIKKKLKKKFIEKTKLNQDQHCGH